MEVVWDILGWVVWPFGPLVLVFVGCPLETQEESPDACDVHLFVLDII